MNPDYKETALCSICGSNILIPEKNWPANNSPIEELEIFLDKK